MLFNSEFEILFAFEFSKDFLILLLLLYNSWLSNFELKWKQLISNDKEGNSLKILSKVFVILSDCSI